MDDQNQKTRYETNHFGYRIATSVGGTATGEGGDRIVVDDPHNAKEIHSATIREGVKTWWTETMSTRRNNILTAGRVIVMQRLHEDDLSALVLSQGGWEHLCLPMEYEGDKRVTGIGWSDPRQNAAQPPRENQPHWESPMGDLLSPGRFPPAEVIKLKREMGSYASAGQLQQRPSPKGGGMLRRDWIRRYDRNHPYHFDRLILSVDSSFKGLLTSKAKNGPDFNVLQIWGENGLGLFLREQRRGQWEYYQLEKEAFEILQRHHCGVILVEDKANGSALISKLTLTFGDRVIGINPEGGKEARASASSPFVEAGGIHIPSDWSEAESFLNEIEKFPNGTNDDQVDGMTQTIVWCQNPDNRVFVPDGFSW